MNQKDLYHASKFHLKHRITEIQCELDVAKVRREQCLVMIILTEGTTAISAFDLNLVR
jgi:hypothetical protein